MQKKNGNNIANKNEEKKRIINFANDMKKIDNLTEEENKKLNFKIFINLILAVAILAYFCLINIGYKNIEKNIFIVDLKVFSMTLLIISIVLFENAYRKDNLNFCIYGIEMLVLATITLFMPYIFFYSNDLIKLICSSTSIYLSVYYVGKCIFIHKKTHKMHLDNLSDVKEIVKK